MNSHTTRTHTMALILTIAMFLTAVGGSLVALAGPAGAVPAAAQSGSYYGANPESPGITGGLSFYVSANRTQLQDISIPNATVTCVPGATNNWYTSPFGIPAAALSSNGSFNGAATEHGEFLGFSATFVYTLRGSVHGATGNTPAGGAGVFRETITYNDGIQHNCTSSYQSWTATRQSQQAQTNAAPPSGSYYAANPESPGITGGLSFYVSASRTQLQDISIPNATVTCVPGATNNWYTSPFGIPAATLKANGSFNGATTEHGQFLGFSATFTYTLQGNFHSLDQNAVERAAGMFHETVTYNDGIQHNCTSNNESWYATRQPQQAQTNAAPPSGSYYGANPESPGITGGLTFRVSASRTQLENISIPNATVTCVPGATNNWYTSPFAISTVVRLNANGSFNASATRAVQLNGFAATATYTIEGNFHSLDQNGVERAAGMFHETVTYTNGGQVNCTSNNQSWYATRTSS